MKFAHLHTHSDFSLLSGLAKIDDLLDACERDGMTAMALTDRNAVYGAVDFTVKARERGINPIIGAEILVSPAGMDLKTNTATAKKTNQLVLLVENEVGYHNLLQIVTKAQLEGFYYQPRVDYAVLREHAEGLIALSGNSYGEVPEALKNDSMDDAREKARLYQEIFGHGNFFLELNDHPNWSEQKKINNGLVAISKETGIPLVAAGDVYYVHKEDAETHDILTCIKMNRKVDEGDRPNFKHLDLSFRTSQEMQELFGVIPGALENTIRIAERCTFEMQLGQTILPIYPLPEGVTDDEELRTLCIKGLEQRFPGQEITEEQRERMDYELGVITTTGYSSYFLIVQDFVNWAREQGIVVGPGRGSAAGSFVSYLTGITNMDPIEYKLLFERFLNPERVSMPDVDLDFADDRREEVLEYCRERYGHDHVAQIITFGTMAARAAIRDAGRALGFPYDFCDKIAKLIPMFSTIEDTLRDVSDFKRLFKENPDARDLISAAKKFEGLNRHSSIHACGVVITDKPVYAYTALQRAADDEKALVTQYASSTKFSAVEKIGLLKMDFLGLKNLTIIQNSIKIIEKIHGIKIDIDTIPLDDTATYELLQTGHTTGIFQLESSGMRRYLKQLGPTVLEDIIAMVALYRPGPMEWIPDFIDGKHGKKEVTYLDPRLENILSDTYGVAVYQEQVMRIAQDVAGFTLGEADILRKAMGKKIFELIKEQKVMFVEGCVKNGTTKKIAEEIFAYIEPFAGYGFNRSHAACYALIGYQTAYLKAHFPAEFMAALMTSDQGNSDRIGIEAAECREMGIEVLPPDVNESFEEFAVIYDEKDTDHKRPRIRFGLNAIKNVGHVVARDIVKARKEGGPFTDLSDFCERVRSKDLNKRGLNALAMVGACEKFGERNQLVQNMEGIVAFIKGLNSSSGQSQGSLFDTAMLSRAEIKLVNMPPATKKQTLDWEKQLLGLYVSDHPAREFKAFFEHMCTPLSELTEDRAQELDQKGCSVGGIIVAISTILLKSGKTMAFVTLEDGTGSIECLIFPKLYEDVKALMIDGQPLVMRGKCSGKDGELKFLADDAQEITPEKKVYAERLEKTHSKHRKPVAPDLRSSLATKPQDNLSPDQQSLEDTGPHEYIVTLPATGTMEVIEHVKTILDTCQPGPTAIILLHNNAKMKTAYSITLTKDCQNRIDKVLTTSTNHTV